MANDPQGSKWRKWDLHFHTPSSFDYENKSITDVEIIEGLLNNSISCVAITDHHLIDITRIKNLQKISNGRITILPGVEFRSELGGKDSIHFIGIFPENSNIDYIWSELEVSCKIIEQKHKNTFDDLSFFCDFKETAKKIHDLGGIVSVHAGTKSNSIENISSEFVFKQAIKKDLINYIDILEIGKLSDRDSYDKIIFPKIQRKLPLIICSDNHNIKNYKCKENLWIKADPTFEGLMQITFETVDRIELCKEPELLSRIKLNSNKYINNISIVKNDRSFAEEWFDKISININPQLVAIIGNKGNGKSALADIIGILGNTSVEEKYFAFLHENKFLNPLSNKGEKFTATLEWINTDTNTKTLEETFAGNLKELVKYIPQHYLEILCNNINSEEEKDQFEEELKKVIFSHVPDEELFGAKNLEQLEEYKKGVIEKEIKIIKEKIRIINKKIVEYEEKNTLQYSTKIQTDLDHLKLHRDNLSKNKPTVVPQPIGKDLVLEKSKIDLEKEISALEKIISDAKTKRKDINENISKLDNIEKEVDLFYQSYLDLKINITPDINYFGLDIDRLVALKIDKKELTVKRDNNKSELLKGNVSLNTKDPNSSISVLERKKKDLEIIKAKFDEPNKLYEKYLEDLKKWNDKIVSLEGSIKIPNSIKYLETEIGFLQNELPNLLNNEYSKRNKVLEELFNKKMEVVTQFKQIYKPLEEFIQTFKLQKINYNVEFEVNLQVRNFIEDFFDLINQRSAGSFRLVNEGREKLKAMILACDFNNFQHVKNFIDTLLTSLKDFDLKRQLNRDRKTEDLYTFLYNLDFLRPQYNINLGGKPIKQLSPGEKGALLLIFYLLIDKNDIPLIIDQPEENLDNQSVYELLVHCIKKAKSRRQIIIVTHNPNIAVVCDAEQIIFTKIEDKYNKNSVTLETGSIENPSINKKIVQILEGTKPAFDNRRLKYTLGGN